MQKILIVVITVIVLVVTFVSCSSTREYTPVLIDGILSSGREVRGQGVRLDDHSVLTSAHVVADDRGIFMIDGQSWRVGSRDIVRDIAILTDADVDISLDQILVSASTGETIRARVWRSGSIVTLTGTVIAIHAQIVGFQSDGRMSDLSGIVLTDLDTISGDSGAPILNARSEIVDVIHTTVYP